MDSDLVKWVLGIKLKPKANSDPIISWVIIRVIELGRGIIYCLRRMYALQSKVHLIDGWEANKRWIVIKKSFCLSMNDKPLGPELALGQFFRSLSNHLRLEHLANAGIVEFHATRSRVEGKYKTLRTMVSTK